MVEGGSILHADHPRKWVIFARRFTDLDTKPYGMNFFVLSDRFPEHSPHLLMGLVAELDSANLLHRGDVPSIQTPDYGNYPLNLTPLGMQFAQFLLR